MSSEVVSCYTINQWNEKYDEAMKSGKLVVVDFTASWCGPCRFIAPILADFAKRFRNKVIFLKVDVDQLKTVAEDYKVDAMPTFVFLKGGKEEERVVGARKDVLLERIRKYAA
ncbi:hypothetical protein BVRB_1g006600 [Beta vulgaris subsp. vulgaris]|uniref:thioredoxin H-type n=1 Tax=Beta vulgaris subsp. vulgaris TaxID=3555 RepID=UPI0005402CF5|nr:thioredoxin H-type [Beta vulgaris subsp. vulgaris]KMT20685.1 hypothetical protein BVRB_1g006600 [Beta vulgaris subsp. vulgaris]